MMFCDIDPEKIIFEPKNGNTFLKYEKKRFKFQIGNKERPVTTRFSVNKPFNENNKSLNLDIVLQDDFKTLLHKIDERIITRAAIYRGATTGDCRLVL